ncbi:MAG: hypothetical protein AABW88_00085 [Nanoarchaeota archaeon]
MKNKNDRAKGNRIQNEFNKILIDNGFITNPNGQAVVWWFNPKTGQRTPFSRKVDHWGLFDIEAISIKYPEYTFLFQLSTVWKTGEDRLKIQEFSASKSRFVFMVRRPDRKPFELALWSNPFFKWNTISMDDFLTRWGTKQKTKQGESQNEKIKTDRIAGNANKRI